MAEIRRLNNVGRWPFARIAEHVEREQGMTSSELFELLLERCNQHRAAVETAGLNL
jgi:dipeptidase